MVFPFVIKILGLEQDHLRLFPLIPRHRTVQHCRTDGSAAVLRIDAELRISERAGPAPSTLDD